MNRTDEMVKVNEEAGGEFVSFNDIDPAVQDHLLAGVEDTWNGYIDLLEENDQPGKDVALLWRDLLVEAGGSVPDEVAALQ
jgi:hypothetical protein